MQEEFLIVQMQIMIFNLQMVLIHLLQMLKDFILVTQVEAINPGITGIIYGSHSAGASLTITPQFKTSAGTLTVGDNGGTSTHYVMEIE